MRTTVVIPAHNAGKTLSECLDALRAQRGAAPFEIVVVDDCSTDETAELATAPDITLIRHEQRAGAAAARNSGVTAAHGEIVCFTDADCAPASNWLATMSATLQNSQVDGCKGIYATRQKQLVARFVQLEYEDKYDLLLKQERINFIDTYSAAYRRQVLLDNEGFDEQFNFLEDQELSFRLAARGYELVFQPDAVVYHYHSSTAGSYFRKKFTIGYWKAQIVRRFPNRALQDSHTPQVMKLQMLLVAAMGAALAASLIWSWSVLLLGLLVALFVLSATPFVAKAWPKDRAVAVAAVPLLLLRALALGTGYAWGVARPAQDIGHEHTIDGLNYVIKRGMDIVGGFVGLLITLAAGIFIAPAIRFDSTGPVIYRQERIGEEGEPFVLYKFRSMLDRPEESLAELLQEAERNFGAVKPVNDPRLTRVGRFLRRWSLDELPQFWNVLKGDMSLVGPRPEETRYVALYDNWQRRRLAIKPGITGPMQVNGRADLPLDARVELELDYIENYSLGRDIALLLQTIPAVIRGEGAR